MRGNRIGPYKCAGCDGRFYASDVFQFGGGFRPAALLNTDDHPMYWRGNTDE